MVSVLLFSLAIFASDRILAEHHHGYGRAVLVALIYVLISWYGFPIFPWTWVWWSLLLFICPLLWVLFFLFYHLNPKRSFAAALACALTLWPFPMDARGYGIFLIVIAALPPLTALVSALYTRGIIVQYRESLYIGILFGLYFAFTITVLDAGGAVILFNLPPPWFLPSFYIIYDIALLNLGVLVFYLLFIIYYYGPGWVLRHQYAGNHQFGPYLIYGADTASSMTIAWGKREDINLSSNSVMLGTDPSVLKPRAEAIQQNGLVEYCCLEGLAPGTKYYYQVPIKAESFSFETAARLDGSTGAVKFDWAFLSDLHASGRDVHGTVKLLQQLQPTLKFIAGGGDIVGDARKRNYWATFLGQFAPLSPFLPFESAPGNHDGGNRNGARTWQDVFPHPYPDPAVGHFFKFIYLNAAIFILDNYNAGMEHRIPSPSQMRWLAGELATLPSHIIHRVVVLHNAIYTTGVQGCDPDLEALLAPLIDQYHVELVLTGHTHIFEAFFRPDLNVPRGVAFIVSGGSGGKLNSGRGINSPYRWEGDTHVAREKPFLKGITWSRFRNDYAVLHYQEIGLRAYHVLRIRVDGDHLTVQAIGLDGTLLYERNFK